MASQSLDKEVPVGQRQPSSTAGEFNNSAYLVQQMLSKLQTATLVRVDACTNSGGLSPVGFVDITPLVNQVDGQGSPTPHVTIYNVPYFRMQGGKNAIICDPEPGDIGMACFASRDISKVKSTKKGANPGSLRRYSFSDALYVGGMLNAVPSQYVQFSASGIRVHSPTQVRLDAPDVKIDADTVEVNATASVTITSPIVAIVAATSTTVTTPLFTVNGTTMLNGPLTQGTGVGGGTAHLAGPMTVDQDVTAAGTSVHAHTHGGVQSGTSNTGGPT
jgi:phage baseplate assembly protein gpV